MLAGLLLACEENSITASAPEKPQTEGGAYLALGDSYTIGESASEDQRWPVQLAARLRAQGIKIEDPEIIARTGWTTGDLSIAMDAAYPKADTAYPKGPYALVTLLIGVNNEFQGMALDAYRIEFRALLKRAIALAGGDSGRVLVLSIPDWGASFFAQGYDTAAIARDIDAFNAANREETSAQGARYLDITPVSREGAGKKEMFAEDGLHPSGLMYKSWVDLAVPALAAMAAH